MTNTRIDTDSLGTRRLPAEALYGVATLRAVENFNISSQKLSNAPELLRALARIKRAAAAANRDIGALRPDVAEAIMRAAEEIERGLHADQFMVDMLEGSGGTSINMNVNEVIANRALQLVGEALGNYQRIHPNDHVNTGQSTNDVVPAAVKLAVYEKSQALIGALAQLAAALEDRAEHFRDVLRIGRTCMQGAQPMRLGQAFGGYAAAIRRLVRKVTAAREEMLVLPLGGTAIGTGLGAAPGYRDAVYQHLREIVGADIRPGENMFDAMQNADGFARISSEIRICAEVIGKIASDLVILGSDAGSGLGELKLPAVQPGSSIMPGKINPVLPMMMQQVVFTVIGNDATVSLACLHGQLEINHFEPVIAYKLFESMDLLTRSVTIFATRCIADIEADIGRSMGNLTQSSALATVFVPTLGYSNVSNLVHASVAEQRSFTELALERKLLTEEEVLDVLDASTNGSIGAV